MTVQASLEVPAQVADILDRACNDCHSYETVWPWYASVAPASWLCVKDVNEGRRHLNFSEWGQYSPKIAAHKLDELIEHVEEGEMPLPVYLPLHPEARLDESERVVLINWARDTREGILAGAEIEGGGDESSDGEHE
jgi:hypothetical protein